MNIAEIKQDAIYSYCSGRLFEITVELSEELAKYHIELRATRGEVARAEVRGKISVLTAIQQIIDKRIDNVLTLERENFHKEFLSNRHFKIAADIVLTKDTFRRIIELSLLGYRHLKEQKSELEADKLE